MEPEELLDMLLVINKRFLDKDWVQQQNGNVLSYTALKLAAIKAYLLEVKEVAQAEMLEAEVDMDEAKATAYLKAKEAHNATAASDLKNMDPDYIAARKEYIGKKVFYDKLRSATADTHDLIESLRSRTIDLQASRKDEGIR